MAENKTPASNLRLLHGGGRGAANPNSKRSLARAAAVARGPIERPVGKVPAGESEEVAAVWAELRRQNRHFTSRDRHVLLEYCRLWVLYEEARAEVAENGVMVEVGGVVREGAWSVRANKLALRLDALRKDLAMTPSTRARSPTPGRPAPKGKESLFDD